MQCLFMQHRDDRDRDRDVGGGDDGCSPSNYSSKLSSLSSLRVNRSALCHLSCTCRC